MRYPEGAMEQAGGSREASGPRKENQDFASMIGSLSLPEIEALSLQLVDDIINRRVNRIEARRRQALLMKEASGFHSVIDGLHNKRWFNAKLEQEIDRSQRDKSPLSVVMFDVDKFKGINDAIGHLNADRFLVEIGRGLQKIARRGTDGVAGLGGDEFGLILPETDKYHALVVAFTVLETVRGIRVVDPKTRELIPISITPSIGVTELILPTAQEEPIASETAEELYDRTDQTVYGAKERGRNCIGLYVGNDPHFNADELQQTLQTVKIDTAQREQVITGVLNNWVPVR